MLCSFYLTLLSFNVKMMLSAGIRGLLLWTGTPLNFDVIGHVNSFEFLLLSVNLLFINNWQMLCFFWISAMIIHVWCHWKYTILFTNVSAAVLTVSEDTVKCCGDRHGFGCFGWLFVLASLVRWQLALPRRSQFIDNLSDMACSLSPRWVSARPVASCKERVWGWH